MTSRRDQSEGPARKFRQGPLDSGSAARTRTSDPVVNSHLLYRLSYRGIFSAGVPARIGRGRNFGGPM